MIKRWIENLSFNASNDDIDMRRASPRRKTDSAIASIGETTYAVEDWSEGGLLLRADDKMFGLNDAFDIVLKFKLPGKLVEVQQAGKIVRKAPNKVAVQFAPLSTNVAQKFKQIIEDAVTREFVESQIA